MVGVFRVVTLYGVSDVHAACIFRVTFETLVSYHYTKRGHISAHLYLKHHRHETLKILINYTEGGDIFFCVLIFMHERVFSLSSGYLKMSLKHTNAFHISISYSSEVVVIWAMFETSDLLAPLTSSLFKNKCYTVPNRGALYIMFTLPIL
jgi:hypothetical protein